MLIINLDYTYSQTYLQIKKTVYVMVVEVGIANW